MNTSDDSSREDLEESGFKVSDKRKFNAEGDPVVSSERQTSSPGSQASPSEEAKTSNIETPDSSPSDQSGSKKEIDFSGFLLSLATSALAHLGELPDPSTGQKSEDPRAAHQMIEIISMLKDKTEGNLEEDERRLIDDILYELRMKYLKQTNSAKL